MSARQKQKTETISFQGLLDWINQLLNLKLTKIEELGSGAVFCQIFELVHPGTIPIHKVNWQAKNQHEFTANLRLLQDAFTKTNIQRPLEPLKLAKAKCAENFELAIWLRKHYLDNIQDTDCTFYSSLSSKGDFSFAHKKVIPKHFNSHIQRESDTFCKCSQCIPSEKEKKIRKEISQIEVKLEMVRQLLRCDENANWKVQMIQEVLNLSYSSKT